MEELVSALLERVGAEMRPEADILPIASTGDATLEVAERCGPIAADYTDDLDYVSLMHRSLGIEGRERRYRTPQELPSHLAGRLGAPDDPDPPSGFGR